MSIDLPPGDNPEDNQPAHSLPNAGPIRKSGTSVRVVANDEGDDVPLATGLRKHNYYNPKNAASFIALIDGWRKMQFADCNISATALGLSPDSLRMKLTCAKLYALEQMQLDEEMRRSIYKFEMSITTSGVVIRMGSKDGPTDYLAALKLGRTEKDPCEEFTKWLDSNPRPRTMFTLRDLSLTNGQLEWFRQTCAQIKKDYEADITQTQVVIIRLS